MSTSKRLSSEHDDSFYTDLSALLGVVLQDVAPDEAKVLTKLGPAFLRNAENLHRHSGLRGVTNEFSSVIELGLVTSHLIAGTLALIDVYLHTRRIREEHETEAKVQQEWVNLLIEEGLDPRLARMIAAQFTPEIVKFLLRRRHDGQ
jgi:hypothetical protein